MNLEDDPRPTDVLTLNVGGQGKVSVMRSTLTQVEGSLLETIFSGRWKQETLDKGEIFVDHPMVVFQPLVEYLRDKACGDDAMMATHRAEPPCLEDFQGNHKLHNQFLRMIEHFGLLQSMYPVRVVQPKAVAPSTAHEVVPLVYANAPLRFTTTRARNFYLEPTAPGMVISYFQIEVDQNIIQHELDKFVVGWKNPQTLRINGRHNSSPSFEDDYGWIFLPDDCPDISFECDRKVLKVSSGVTQQENRFAAVPLNYVPVFGGHGSWTISNVVLCPAQDV